MLFHFRQILQNFLTRYDTKFLALKKNGKNTNDTLILSLLLNSSKLLNEIWYKVSGAEIIKNYSFLSFGKFSKLFNEVQL